MNRPEDQVLVIFGASGDLTKRMLMPSLYELHARQMLPERFVILGTSRTPMSDDEFRLSIRVMLQELKGECDTHEGRVLSGDSADFSTGDNEIFGAELFVPGERKRRLASYRGGETFRN